MPVPILDCSIVTFTPLLEKLDLSWSSIWSSFASKVIKTGIMFGSCYTVCGSLGITGTEGLAGLVLNTEGVEGPVVNFTNCGLIDKAMIVVPIESSLITFDVVARASGFGQLWPTNQNNMIGAHLSGFLLISIPRDESTLLFSKPEVDISFRAVWSDEWPDSESVLFPSVPTADLLKEYTNLLQKEAREHIVPKLKDAIQSKNAIFDCSWPQIFAQTCSSTTTMPANACHPCDTCCKCLIQQRCDGECADCPCVNCNESILWKILLTISALLMIIISISAIITWNL
jgi:hypothetical protein